MDCPRTSRTGENPRLGVARSAAQQVEEALRTHPFRMTALAGTTRTSPTGGFASSSDERGIGRASVGDEQKLNQSLAVFFTEWPRMKFIRCLRDVG